IPTGARGTLSAGIVCALPFFAYGFGKLDAMAVQGIPSLLKAKAPLIVVRCDNDVSLVVNRYLGTLGEFAVFLTPANDVVVGHWNHIGTLQWRRETETISGKDAAT